MAAGAVALPCLWTHRLHHDTFNVLICSFVALDFLLCLFAPYFRAVVPYTSSLVNIINIELL